ncbi:MAG: transposase [Hydrogenophaga sp.]|uniref:transposase n=1 Tax=Hydrogenophaga sp. TaxID=1904254 RepID=UPI002736094D|nr:transposase [Hydrogenophaga sp.]MDP3347112.1 transposase [Hydrogenophaga sp.]MDP3805294.1 transposase [Hydrogenophaga sp.]MDP3927305.1 transposase [Hydrogenophaga sp.]
MSPLRQSMVDAMTVRGLSVRTIGCYTESISRPSRHHGGQLYLSRYTHRTAIGNERILGLQGDEVVISARAKRSEGQENFMARVARVNIQQCPVCQQGRLGVVQTLARAKHLPDPFEGSARKANSRAARLRRSRAGKHVAVAAQQTGTVTRKRPLQAPSQAIMTSHSGGGDIINPLFR